MRDAAAIRRAAQDHGAVGATLSGAGPTVLALVTPERASTVAGAFMETASHLGVAGRVATLVPVATGARLLEPAASRT